MPPKTLFRVGLGLFLIATVIYSCTAYWFETRILVPLDIPSSLGTRETKSPPFQINLHSSYYVSMQLDDSHDDWYYDGRCNSRNALGWEWRVYRLGSKPGETPELWASRQVTRGYDRSFSDSFDAQSGRYQLELDLPAGASCLDFRHPRFSVHTSAGGYRQAVVFILSICAFWEGLGAVLILFAVGRVLRRRFAIGEPPRMFPGMVLRNVLPIKKRAPPQLIHGMPHWGLFCGAVLWVLIFVFMVVPTPIPRMGLWVSWKTHYATAWQKGPWPDTLQVYVAATGYRPRFLINGQEVDRMALRTRLLEQLSRRAEWSVYFEADPDTLYMDDVYAIDTIQGCGAKVIWITPKMREECRTNSTREIVLGSSRRKVCR